MAEEKVKNQGVDFQIKPAASFVNSAKDLISETYKRRIEHGGNILPEAKKTERVVIERLKDGEFDEYNNDRSLMNDLFKYAKGRARKVKQNEVERLSHTNEKPIDCEEKFRFVPSRKNETMKKAVQKKNRKVF